MKNQELWILIHSTYNSTEMDNLYPFYIESYDNWYRVDIYRGGDSISLKIYKEYSIAFQSCKYRIELMKNGNYYRQTQHELIWKVINEEFIPLFRDIKINQLINI